MKHLFLFLTFLLTSLAFSFGKGTLTINYSYTHIEVGYDHQTKCLVYIDGELVMESDAKPQSEATTLKIKVPKGKHQVRIVMMALYEGNWEEHTIDNEYSTNAFFNESMNLVKKNAITMEFDLDQPNAIIKTE